MLLDSKSTISSLAEKGKVCYLIFLKFQWLWAGPNWPSTVNSEIFIASANPSLKNMMLAIVQISLNGRYTSLILVHMDKPSKSRTPQWGIFNTVRFLKLVPKARRLGM